ncbi:VOC family protein [Stieleria sp.]|uniref:Glyoxalase-like domain protein n=1 Tax=Stieleria magnilauensis TaxID=2527963 RepID=A0ABX5XU88_9BACT|nr:Glyoxalase-like domain protein [Planctomycetes bacterium TBK1r]
MTVQKIPPNSEGFIPYLIVQNAAEAIDFYARAFGGRKGTVLKMPTGDVGHAEVIIGRTRIMLAEENPDWGFQGAKSLGGCPLTLTLYVEDVDSMAKQAIDAGMTVKRELADQFYGDRMVTLTDPYGYDWCLGTHIEDVDDEEIQRRMSQH